MTRARAPNNVRRYDGRPNTPQTCTLWVSIAGNTPTPSPGYTSGHVRTPRPPLLVGTRRRPALLSARIPAPLHTLDDLRPLLPQNLGPNCQAPAGEDPMHPKVPTSWSGMFLTVFFLTVGGYLGGGVAINRSRGEEHWLPNPLFWAALGVRNRHTFLHRKSLTRLLSC